MWEGKKGLWKAEPNIDHRTLRLSELQKVAGQGSR